MKKWNGIISLNMVGIMSKETKSAGSLKSICLRLGIMYCRNYSYPQSLVIKLEEETYVGSIEIETHEIFIRKVFFVVCFHETISEFDDHCFWSEGYTIPREQIAYSQLQRPNTILLCGQWNVQNQKISFLR